MAANKKTPPFPQRLIDFCYADLNQDSDVEKMNAVVELVGLMTDDKREVDLTSSLSFALEYWDLVLEAQEEMLSGLQTLYSFKNDDFFIVVTEMPSFRWENGRFSFGYFQGYYENPLFEENLLKKVALEICDEHADDNVIDRIEIHRAFLHFFSHIDGFTLDSLSKCPECRNIFFNASKRQKIYCSKRCQNYASVKRVREKKKLVEK